MKRPLVALMTHHPPERVAVIHSWWQEFTGQDVLIVHGGRPADFAALTCSRKVFVDDPRLRTRDHQRERQSYAGVLRAVAAHGALADASSVTLIEFDCLPVVPDLPDRLENLLEEEGAGLLGSRLRRIDRTGHPHWLYHMAEPGFREMFRSFSVRSDPEVVLSMLGCVTVWRPEVLAAVAAIPEEVPVYLELWLPTVAHHLGSRVRGLGALDDCIHYRGDYTPELDALRRRGAQVVHPVKQFWDAPRMLR